MKLLSTSFLLFIFLFTINIYAQKPGNNPGRIKDLLAQCDSVKNNFELAAKDNGSLLRKLSFEGLMISAAGDAANRSKFYYYAASGFIFVDPINVDTVTYYFLKSLDEAKKIRSSILIVNAAVSMMHIGFEMRDSNETETYKNIIQAVIDTTKDKAALENGYAALGTYYQQKSYYSTAQDYFFKTILLQQESQSAWTLKDKNDFANRCYTLAQLYVKTGTFDKAFDILNTGKPYRVSSSQTDIRYKTLLLDLFSKSGNIDSALYYLHNYIDPLEAKFITRGTVPDFLIVSNLSVSRYYLDHNLNEQAWLYLQKINSYPTEKIQPFESYQIQKITGRYYVQIHNFSKAIPLFMQALPVAKQLNKEDYTDILKYIAVAYEGEGNQSQSLQFYKSYNGNLDSLIKEKLSKNFADQQTRYETNQKQQQIVSLNKENKLSALELENASRTKWLLVLGLIALSIIALLFFFIYKNREKLNRQLNLQKEELQILNNQLSVANETKARLFGIISHDLRSPVSRISQLMQLQKNNPAMLNEQSIQKHEASIKQAMESVLETMEDLLLWSKSQMQQFVANDTSVNISDVVLKESDFLRTAMEEKNITFNNRLPENYIETTDENFISIIIRNLVQNAIKYSDANSIITIDANKKQLRIINIATNTTAEILNDQLNNKNVNSNTSGIGLQIIKDLSVQLKLQIYFEKEDNKSIAAVIHFTN